MQWTEVETSNRWENLEVGQKSAFRESPSKMHWVVSRVLTRSKTRTSISILVSSPMLSSTSVKRSAKIKVLEDGPLWELTVYIVRFDHTSCVRMRCQLTPRTSCRFGYTQSRNHTTRPSGLACWCLMKKEWRRRYKECSERSIAGRKRSRQWVESV